MFAIGSEEEARMASSLGIVVVNPSCSVDRFLRPNFSATTSSSVYLRCWRGRINVGTVACSRRDVGGLIVSGCLSSPDSSSPPSSISGPKTKLYVSGKLPSLSLSVVKTLLVGV